MAAAVSAGTILVPAGPAGAVPPPPIEPSLSVVDSGGNPSSSVVVGDGMTTRTTAPINEVGQTSQRIVTTWDPAQSAVDTSSIVTPEGWSKQFTDDGSTWSSTAPADASTISGVRTEGAVDSDGIFGGSQVSTATGTGTVLEGAGAFSGASGGDGYDAFATSKYVLNVWHHNGGAFFMDCHLKTTGDSCGPVYGVGGTATSMGSTGDVVGDKVYSMVGDYESNSYGALCTDISALPFTSCGFTPLASTGWVSWPVLGTQTLSGTKLYSALNSGELMCFDTSTSSACDGEPYILPSYNHSLGNMGSYAVSDSGRVFITDNKVWCIDADTGSACAGSWPVSGPDGDFLGYPHPAIPMRDTDGNIDGACMILPAGTCWDLSGESTTYPPALLDLTNTYPVSNDVGVSNWDFTGTRQYWLTGPWNDPSNTSYPVCWDWTTQAACAGFSSNVTNGTLRYAIRVDDTNPNCIWTNGDNGIISVFDALTGGAGCVQPDPTVVFPYTTLVPRMGCDEAGRVRAFRDLRLTVPAGVSRSGLKVTVKDSSNNPVAGYIDLSPDSAGAIDLSALDPGVTGTHPSFEANSPGTSTVDAAAITAALRFVSDPPELCLTVSSLQDCPTLSPGLSSAPTLPVSDVAIAAETVAIVDDVETPTALSQAVTRADMGNCLGTVSGTALRTFPGGDVPIAGVTVHLVGPDSTVVATTTTASDGTYMFSNANPADYTVTMAGESSPAAVAATEVTTADFNVPADRPVAGPVSSVTLQNSAATLAIDATVDPTTTVDLSSVQLWDPAEESWGNSVAVTGEGDWIVTSGGDLRFTPEIGFTGDSSAVTYRFRDGYGTASAGSTARMTVLAVLPTAHPVAASGIRGDTISMIPNGVGPNVPLDGSSLALIDGSSGDPVRVSSMTVPGVGTFTVNVSSGRVDFTPLGDFVGSATIIYRVLDTTGREATSTMTVRLDPISLTGDTTTVGVGQTATPSVHGVPEGSVVTVPDSAAGASSVTISGSVVTVVPNPGFAGRIVVPVTVVHGTATMTISVVVIVKPAAVTHGWHDLTTRATTVVHWPATPGAIAYEVRVNGVLKCVTSARTCDVAKLLGPKAKVTVTAVGHNAVKGTATRQPYRTHGCVQIGAVHFASNSAELRKSARKHLTRLAKVINVQGFTRGCLVGHTDSIGSLAHNKVLSKHRVHHVAAYLKHRKHHPVYRKSYNGELNPSSSNHKGSGRAANRRVEISVI